MRSGQYTQLDENPLPSSTVADLSNTKIKIPGLKSLIDGKTEVLMSSLELGRKILKSQPSSIKSKLADAISEVLSADNCVMTILLLDQNNLGDGDLEKIIRASKTLRFLNLSGNKFRKKAAEALADLLSKDDCKLQELILSDALDNSTFIIICDALKTNRSLKVLSVVGSKKLKIGESGYTKLSQAILLNENLSLTKIDLSGNQTLRDMPDAKNAIAVALEQNKSLLSFILPGPLDRQIQGRITNAIIRNLSILPSVRSNTLLPGDNQEIKSAAIRKIEGDKNANDFYIKFQVLFIAILKLVQETAPTTTATEPDESTIYRSIALRIRNSPKTGQVSFSDSPKIISGSDQEIGSLVEYIARQAALNEIVTKYRNRLHPRLDVLSTDVCVMPKAVTDIAKILAELILENNAQTQQPEVINKNLGDKLCEMLSNKIGEIERDYIEARGLGVAVGNSRQLPISHSFEVLRHPIAGASRVIDIEGQPSTSPSNSRVERNRCVIL
jgi:hypothetical protein